MSCSSVDLYAGYSFIKMSCIFPICRHFLLLNSQGSPRHSPSVYLLFITVCRMDSTDERKVAVEEEGDPFPFPTLPDDILVKCLGVLSIKMRCIVRGCNKKLDKVCASVSSETQLCHPNMNFLKQLENLPPKQTFFYNSNTAKT